MFLSKNKKNNIYPCKPPVLLNNSRVLSVSILYSHVVVMAMYYRIIALVLVNIFTNWYISSIPKYQSI